MRPDHIATDEPGSPATGRQVAHRPMCLPIATMRRVYQVDEVERRLNKLPQKEHEPLRATYERMLELGPERFQVKPSGLPALADLYDDLPNFTEALDDLYSRPTLRP